MIPPFISAIPSAAGRGDTSAPFWKSRSRWGGSSRAFCQGREKVSVREISPVPVFDFPGGSKCPASRFRQNFSAAQRHGRDSGGYQFFAPSANSAQRGLR